MSQPELQLNRLFNAKRIRGDLMFIESDPKDIEKSISVVLKIWMSWNFSGQKSSISSRKRSLKYIQKKKRSNDFVNSVLEHNGHVTSPAEVKHLVNISYKEDIKSYLRQEIQY